MQLYGDGHLRVSSATPAATPALHIGGWAQSTIACPAGAVDIWPGVSIQNVVDSYGGNTTFCLRAGTHSLRSSIRPRTGNTFVGEYGAILDGSGWRRAMTRRPRSGRTTKTSTT